MTPGQGEAKCAVEAAPPGRLRMGRVVVEVARIYARRWPLLWITAAITFVALDLVTGVLWPIFASDTASAAAAALVTIAASYYYQGVVASIVAAWVRGEPAPSAWRVLRRVPTLRLLALDVLATTAAYVGLALAVVPGILVFTVTAVVAPVAVLEGRSVFACFRRSQALVAPSFWRVLVGVVGLVALLFVATGAAILGAGELSNGSIWGYWVGALAANVVFAPFSALAAGVTYFELLRLARGEAGA